MKRKLFNMAWTLAAPLAFVLVLAGCSTTNYTPVDVTNTMAAQITNMEMHELEPGETVQTLYLERTGSLVLDLNKYEGGVWYRTHQDKIVSIEAVGEEKTTTFPLYQVKKTNIWRIEYVD
jgi:hypothetical protein